MIHEFGRNPRILKVLFDEFRVLLVERLHGSGGLRPCAKRRGADQRTHENGNTREAEIASHAAMVTGARAAGAPFLPLLPAALPCPSCPPSCPSCPLYAEDNFRDR